MDDNESKENPSTGFNKLDLNQLQAFSFGTQWTQDKSSPADKQQGGGRPRRDDRRDGPSEPRRDRRSFSKPAGGPSERQDVGRPAEGGGGDRRPGPGRDLRGGPRGEARGDSRFPGPSAQQDRFPYVSPYFETSFYPEDTSFNALAKTIRASCRTIELFEIARTVVDKNDRFIVVMTRKTSGKEKEPIFISVPDGLPFETEEGVVNHVLANHLGKFFDVADVEVEAPKGNFQVINKCGVTGELLGPPNYHRYNQLVQQHFAAQISRMSEEAFRARIESVRDPEVATQWMDKMKKVTRYTWKVAGAATAGAKTAEASAPATAPAEAESAPTETADETPAAVDSTPVENAAAPAEAPAEASTAPKALSFDTLEDARIFLLTEARDRLVKTVETVRFHGRLLENLPPGEMRAAVEGALEGQRRFPLDTANGLRGRLRREHFTIFKKGSKGASYVCAVKRKFRTLGQTFSDTIGALIAFIESNLMTKVSDLPAKFLGIEAPKPAAEILTEGAPAEVAAPVELSVEQREKLVRMQGDLRWLVMEGYVTEFLDGRLFAAPPMTESKKRTTDESDNDPENFPDTPESNPPMSVKAAAKPVAESPAAPEAAVAPAASAEPEASKPAAEETPVVEPTPKPPVVPPAANVAPTVEPKAAAAEEELDTPQHTD